MEIEKRTKAYLQKTAEIIQQIPDKDFTKENLKSILLRLATKLCKLETPEDILNFKQ